MGSTSSKDNDANPHDLGTNVSGVPSSPKMRQYPLHHHPHYSTAHNSSDSSMHGDGSGGGSAAGGYGPSGHQPPGAPTSASGYQDHGGTRTGGGGGSGGRSGGDAMEIDQTSNELPYGIPGGRSGQTDILSNNEVNPPSVDTRLLPVPQHVALNHLYCTAIKDGMMVLGVTQRYKQKFVTTVYYSLMPGTS
ncbi:hypothetical protein ATCC90586_000916 [Pythium insidiosum]|nr:hypothetical protein ATCC90586_000916 [Pythium insidiosum]